MMRAESNFNGRRSQQRSTVRGLKMKRFLKKAYLIAGSALFCILSGCASLVENTLQHENREMYYKGEIPYAEYRVRDQQLDQFDEQFGTNKR
ncbi:hypothetical protein P4E94_10060 [Pontiellaceae bacterium B12219]|nr:hypothetical protein [Pontiellaceae bacterium B12219]